MVKTVVLVPGLMGSVLGRDLAPGQPVPVWWNPSRMARGEYTYLQLAADGESPGPLANGVALRPFPQVPNWGGWMRLRSHLVDENWSVVWWPYDWRRDIRDSAAALADFLLGTAVTGDFYVLAHSMGGLVARLAYPTFAAAGAPARWKRSLYVCTPHYGSHEAAQYLAAPVQFRDLAGYLLPGVWSGPAQLPSAPLRALLQRKMRPIVSTWPALYQLLPSIQGTWTQTRPLDPLLYQSATYADENDTVTQNWLNVANATRTVLDTSLGGPRPEERVVQVRGTQTADALIRRDHLGDSTSYATAQGDGAVTEDRGVLADVPTSLHVQGTVHCDVLGFPAFLARVSGLLTAGDAPPAVANPVVPVIAPKLVGVNPAAVVPAPLPMLQRVGDP